MQAIKGRFFSGDGSKGQTSLELHSITLKNGKVGGGKQAFDVHPFPCISDAESCIFLCHFWEFSPLPNGLYVADSNFRSMSSADSICRRGIVTKRGAPVRTRCVLQAAFSKSASGLSSACVL
jgi:hypothetical protein